MGKKSFFVSTPIYYPSGNLHIGHVYSTTLADVLARYKREQGYDVFFMTGSDEHGQKIEKKAKENNKKPKEFVDVLVKEFKSLWKDLDISYSRFIRTTDKDHERCIQKIFSTLLEKDLIYKSKYKGLYCISCEEFLTSSQIFEEKCMICKSKPTITEEETYMLRVTKFKQFLIELLNSDFLIPESRRNEMINSFVDNNLEDLSITRITFSWGVPIVEDPKHIMYVWIDALSNYISGLGYLSENDENFKKFWSKDTEIVQIIGKEITRFHSIYWPVILKSLNLRMPTKLISHGWILSKGMKMSKSLGNVVDPLQFIKKYGSDAVRFYVVNNLPYASDGDITEELMTESYNLNLANNIGNLFSRVSNMILTNFDGILKPFDIKKNSLYKETIKTIKKYDDLMNLYNMSEATKVVLELGNICNKYIEDFKPWEVKKENKLKELNNFLFELQYTLSVISILLKPILVKTYPLMCNQIGLENNITIDDIKNLEVKFNKIKEKLILFNRIK